RRFIAPSRAGGAGAPLPPFGAAGPGLGAAGAAAARVAAAVGVHPARVRTTRAAASAAPATAVAADHVEALLAVFRDVLGTDEVGPDDNFFAAGGDSIRA